MVGPIDQAWVRDQLVTYGHSFLAETGLPDPAGYYARQLAAQFDMAYPSNDGINLKRAVGGSYAESTADVMLTGQPWTSSKKLGSDTVLLIEALINTARKHGVDPVTRQGAEHALRTMCALGSSLEVLPDSATTFTYSAMWSTLSGSGFHRGSCHSTRTAGNYVTFTVPTDGSHFLTFAAKAGLPASVIEFQRLDTGEVFRTWTNQDQAQANLSRPYVPAAIPLRVPAGTPVRVGLVSGSLICDGLIVPATRPGPILLMKEPYLEDYSRSTMFPNGSDEALEYFNDLLDTMADEFPNVLVADPNTGGHWDKTAHILESDGVHPNAAGHQALADTMLDAIRAGLERKAYEAGLAP